MRRSNARYDVSMRSRVSLFALLLVAGSLALPLVAQAGGIPFFGPIIPQAEDQAVCAAGWGMLITVFNNIISLLITLAIVFVAPLMIAYSGFLFVVNPVNASGKEQAKKILINTIIGIVIALAGWMIVAALMAALYNANTKDSSGSAWGTWSQLITSGGAPICIPLAGSLKSVITPPLVIDIAPADEQLARRINAFQRAVSAAGISAVYEVPNETEKSKIINAGATGQVIVVSGVAPHFSVYGSGGSGGSVTSELKKNPTCATCVPITRITCKSGASCKAAESLVNMLNKIPVNDSSTGAWIVAEAFPPTVSHASACHYNGTCIDAAFR